MNRSGLLYFEIASTNQSKITPFRLSSESSLKLGVSSAAETLEWTDFETLPGKERRYRSRLSSLAEITSTSELTYFDEERPDEEAVDEVLTLLTLGVTSNGVCALSSWTDKIELLLSGERGSKFFALSISFCIL